MNIYIDKIMKKLPLLINIILGVAIVVLYVLHFADTDSKSNKESKAYSKEVVRPEFPLIVYVNFDTLLLNYDFYYDLQGELEEKRKTSEAELSSRSKAYEKGAADYQEKVQKGLVTRSTAQELEQQLIQEQQNLLQLRDNLASQLMEEEQVMNRQIVNSIMEYIKEYNKVHNYQYVISYQFGGPLLFANDSLNITNEIIKGLNEKYNRERER
jgi:outer membrane protein